MPVTFSECVHKAVGSIIFISKLLFPNRFDHLIVTEVAGVSSQNLVLSEAQNNSDQKRPQLFYLLLNTEKSLEESMIWCFLFGICYFGHGLFCKIKYMYIVLKAAILCMFLVIHWDICLSAYLCQNNLSTYFCQNTFGRLKCNIYGCVLMGWSCTHL